MRAKNDDDHHDNFAIQTPGGLIYMVNNMYERLGLFWRL